jgi:hypothetical protein
VRGGRRGSRAGRLAAGDRRSASRPARPSNYETLLGTELRWSLRGRLSAVTRRSHEERLLRALEQASGPDRPTCFPVHIWRWRYELILLAGLAVACAVVVHALGLIPGIVVLSALLGIVSPPWPGWLRGVAWHVVTPHRIRAGLSAAGVHNRRGIYPQVRMVASEEYGERVVLWCPAGTTAEDIYSARAILRTACWAADVRVRCDVQRSHIVTLYVIRRGESISRVHRDDPDFITPWPLDADGTEGYPDPVRRSPDLMSGRR